MVVLTEKSEQQSVQPVKMRMQLSSEVRDDRWDDFLRENPLGQFQQSSAWAEAKLREGWAPLRAFVSREGRIASGFQLLWRTSSFGRIGYISKGPVLASEDPEFIHLLIRMIKRIARQLKFTALIVQPPDASQVESGSLEGHGFLPDKFYRIINANWFVDVSKGTNVLIAGMRRRTLQEIRQAKRRGVTVRPGNEHDINKVFSLILQSCQRQGEAKPNPPNEQSFLGLWRAFHTRNAAKLWVAEHESETIAGLFCIAFGQRKTLWKKGSSSAHAHRHAMSLLCHHALEWACLNGYQYADFGGFDREMAEVILSGQQVLGSQKESRHFYNVGFGGRPKLLPKATIFIPNTVLRTIYKWLPTPRRT